MHPLRSYLEETGASVSGFASLVGISRQTLHRILSGAQSPKPALARRIVDAAGGALSFEELYPADENAGGVVDFSSARKTREKSVGVEETLDEALLMRVLDLTLYAITRPPISSGASRLSSAAASGAPPDTLVEAATEAVAHTYEALSGVTSRRGPDRLAQALRPVLEEILKETPAPQWDPDHRGRLPAAAADRAARLYFQALRPEGTDGSRK